MKIIVIQQKPGVVRLIVNDVAVELDMLEARTLRDGLTSAIQYADPDGFQHVLTIEG